MSSYFPTQLTFLAFFSCSWILGIVFPKSRGEERVKEGGGGRQSHTRQAFTFWKEHARHFKVKSELFLASTLLLLSLVVFLFPPLYFTFFFLWRVGLCFQCSSSGSRRGRDREREAYYYQKTPAFVFPRSEAILISPHLSQITTPPPL